MSSPFADVDNTIPASFTSDSVTYLRPQSIVAGSAEEPDPEACTHTIDFLEYSTTPVQNFSAYKCNNPPTNPTRPSALGIPQEGTPLIRQAEFLNTPTAKGYESIKEERKAKSLHRKCPSLGSTSEADEASSVKRRPVRKSTFSQTLFNTVAVLLGMGLMSEPLAFAYAGWGCGTLLLVFYGFSACYTAKILARFIIEDPTVRTYTDIGRRAFGKGSMYFIGVVFCLEIFAVMVSFVTLYADSFETVAPAHSATFYKLLGLIAFLPIVFLPLSWLSITSLLGIGSSILLIAVILIDGLTKKTAPGSIWDPLPSNLGVASFQKLGISFGLFMAGFSGHVTIPGLVHNMIDPSRFEEMINIAFVLATVLYGIVGAAGYRMFGNGVSGEFSQDLFATPGYNKLVNRIALYALVITPMTRFGLAAHPMNATLEQLLGIDSHSTNHDHDPDARVQSRITLRQFASIVQRVVVTMVVVAVSIAIPEFGSIMGFIGTVFAFLMSFIGPICAKIAFEKRCSGSDALMVVIGVSMASWGTFSVVYSH